MGSNQKLTGEKETAPPDIISGAVDMRHVVDQYGFFTKFLFVLIHFLKYNDLITNEKKAAELQREFVKKYLKIENNVCFFFSKHTLLIILYKKCLQVT